MRTVALLLAVVVTTVLAQGLPAKPACTHPEGCTYLWLANYVPSTAAPQFNFLVDQVLVKESVNYGAPPEVIQVACNVSTLTTYQLAVSASLGGGQSSPVSIELQCNKVYSFFAYRRPNVQNVEQYSPAVRMIDSVAAGAYMSGLVFNGVYRGGNINAKYCDQNNAVCSTDRQDQRNNLNTAVGLWGEMQLKMLTSFENPVTITGNQLTLYNDIVTGTTADVRVWIFYGDNQDRTNFPIQGGVSAASIATISMTLLVALSALVASML